MSFSDSSDDNSIQIKEAVDTSVLRDDFYKEMSEEIFNDGQVSLENNVRETVSKNIIEKPKSKRYLNGEDFDFELNYVKIPETMQTYFAKKLSNLISEQIEFVKILHDRKTEKKLKNRNGIKLLKESENNISLEADDLIYPTVKPIIKKRKFETDPDDCLSEYEKLKLVSVEAEDIINKTDMKYWKDRKKSKIFCYKSKSGPHQFIEPENEFSAIRRKNSWTVKKIARKK